MKEQIKRPLSSLLKRPASRSGSRDRASSRDRDSGPENIELPAGDEPSRLHDKPVKKMGMRILTYTKHMQIHLRSTYS